MDHTTHIKKIKLQVEYVVRSVKLRTKSLISSTMGDLFGTAGSVKNLETVVTVL